MKTSSSAYQKHFILALQFAAERLQFLPKSSTLCQLSIHCRTYRHDTKLLSDSHKYRLRTGGDKTTPLSS
jgi:hypothetical protein